MPGLIIEDPAPHEPFKKTTLITMEAAERAFDYACHDWEFDFLKGYLACVQDVFNDAYTDTMLAVVYHDRNTHKPVTDRYAGPWFWKNLGGVQVVNPFLVVDYLIGKSNPHYLVANTPGFGALKFTRSFGRNDLRSYFRHELFKASLPQVKERMRGKILFRNGNVNTVRIRVPHQ